MSIRKKIIVNMLAVILLSLAVIGVMYYLIMKTDRHFNETIETNMPLISTVNSVANNTYDIKNELYYYITGDKEALVELNELRRETIQLLESDAIVENGISVSEFEEAKVKFNQVMDQTSVAIATYDFAGQEEAITIINTKIKPLHFELTNLTDAIVKKLDANLAQAQVRGDELAQQAKIIAIVAVVILYSIASFIVVTLIRRIALPLQKIEYRAKELATGNLTVKDLQMQEDDEIAHVANAFNQMKHTLKGLIRSIADNAENLTASVEELNSSALEISNSSLAVVERAEKASIDMSSSAITARESSIAMDETSVAIQRIAESAQMLNITANDTTSKANTGSTNIQSAQTQMSMIYDSTKLTTQLIQKLSEQSEEIEMISKVITTIADQTNLLSLNAAIEAARAGEHGKGFAVVADEVRKLAEQSSQSASKIVHLTTEIQTDTRDVENAVKLSLANVEDGVKAIEKADISFDDIVSAVEEMRGQIESISAISQEISASTEEVAASVAEMVNSSEVNALDFDETKAAINQQVSTLQEVSAITNDLSERANALRDEVKQFII